MCPDFRNLTIYGPESDTFGSYPIPFTPPSGVEYRLETAFGSETYYTIAWDWDLETVTIRNRKQSIDIGEPIPSGMAIAGLTSTPYGPLELKLSNDPRLEGYDVYVVSTSLGMDFNTLVRSRDIGIFQRVESFKPTAPLPPPLLIEGLVGSPVIPLLNHDDVPILMKQSAGYTPEGVVVAFGLDSVDDIPTKPQVSQTNPPLIIDPYSEKPFKIYITDDPENPLQQQMYDLEWELTIPLNPIEPEPEPEPTSTSILQDVKKLLSVPDNYDVFDLDISIWINSAFSTLHELGVGGQSAPFQITGPTETWLDFTPDETMWNNVKTYVYLRARLGFDPPQSAHANAAMQKMVEEHEWRLNVKKEGDIL
jgi:hypothetical protein